MNQNVAAIPSFIPTKSIFFMQFKSSYKKRKVFVSQIGCIV